MKLGSVNQSAPSSADSGSLPHLTPEAMSLARARTQVAEGLDLLIRQTREKSLHCGPKGKAEALVGSALVLFPFEIGTQIYDTLAGIEEEASEEVWGKLAKLPSSSIREPRRNS